MNPRHALTAFAVIPVLFVAGCATGTGPKEEAPDGSSGPVSSAPPAATPDAKSDVDQFRDHAKRNGTPQEQDAVTHVVRMRTTGSGNLQVTTITTDLEGDLLSPAAKTGKLIAELFADWKKTDHGSALVSVNAADGGLLANGNY